MVLILPYASSNPNPLPGRRFGLVWHFSRCLKRRTLILNALGTDVTHELLGEDMSVGHAMSFSPHAHSEVVLSLALLLWAVCGCRRCTR